MSGQKKGIFDKQKTACLEGVDLSKKGSVDAPIQQLVSAINAENDFFTTSSCSGRIMVVENTDTSGVKKKGCRWIFSSHDKTTMEELKPKLEDIKADAVFKFEPFVLHVQCRSLSDGQNMMSCGITSGYRNSGISLSTKGKCIVAIRSTHSLEVPLSMDGRLLVNDEYLSYLVKVANNKMEENFTMINRYFSAFKTYIEASRHNQQQDAAKHGKQNDMQVPENKQSVTSTRKHKLPEHNNRKPESFDLSCKQVEENIDDICDLFGDCVT